MAKLAGLHDFVQEQSAAYETKLGRAGIGRRAEQLARLGLARAIVMEPAVLTIDYTYAAIEEEAERPLRAAIRAALADRTIITATARLFICQDADRIVVMRQGRIIEMDTHEALLAHPGVYRRMYMRQMGLVDADSTEQV